MMNSRYKISISALLSLLLTLVPDKAIATTFQLQENYEGETFLSGFSWTTGSDPSGGHVNYVDQGTALQRNLTYASGNTFIMRADDTNVASPGAGRDSIRISSNSAFTDSVTVLDLQHMPGGCGQWPAFWTTQLGNWPGGGEVDIIEGINERNYNQASLHTSSGCSMPPNRNEKGAAGPNNCDTSVNYNSGCQVRFTPNTFGQSMNGGGGGWFAITRTASEGIAMYFWPRYDGSVPAEIRNGASSVTPSGSWGQPQALFPATDSCDFNSHLAPHQIIINLSFCGPWAGQPANFGSCGSSCNDYVDNNPSAFTDAYWEINALRVYTP